MIFDIVVSKLTEVNKGLKDKKKMVNKTGF